MAQPSVVNYFNTRKRAALSDTKSAVAKKVLVLDKSLQNSASDFKKPTQILNGKDSESDVSPATIVIPREIVLNKNIVADKKQHKTTQKAKTRKKAEDGQKNIEQFLHIISTSCQNNNVNGDTEKSEDIVDAMESSTSQLKEAPKKHKVTNKELQLQALKEKLLHSNKLRELKLSMNRFKEKAEKLKEIDGQNVQENHATEKPHNEGAVKNAMDKVNELSVNDIKKKLTRSARLAELKASMVKMKEGEKKLEELELRKASKEEENVPAIKTFRKLELEVPLSPQKAQSPQKQYLSPKKDSSVRRNIFNLASPTKNAVELSFSPSKLAYESDSKSLYLPFKYRSLLEVFRSVDTVLQIMYNRKETVTFHKLKSAVEKLLKRNLFERHLAQIAKVSPDAFDFRIEKLREFGAGKRQEKWEMTVYPKVNTDYMTAELLVERRKQFQATLLEKTKDYHDEFLKGMGLTVSRAQLKRWHPEFDIEKVPDIEQGDLPRPPNDEKFHTGQEVLERARSLFHCNKRMEAALERLKSAEEEKNNNVQKEDVADEAKVEGPSMKGIPKSLLEKVRQRQAAKMLENMTRSEEKDQTMQMYSKLPELARLTRNLFVAEKKGVLPLEIVTDKLGNSFKSFLTKNEIEQHLRIISKEVPGWLVFHELRNAVYVKVSKNADLNLVLNKLESSLKEKF